MPFTRRIAVGGAVVATLAAAPAAAREPFRVENPLSRRYCGRGRLRACRRVLATTLAAAAGDVRTQYDAALAQVRVRTTGCEQDPVCDQIEFVTAGAVETPAIPWQDRPTFQQVVEIR